MKKQTRISSKGSLNLRRMHSVNRVGASGPPLDPYYGHAVSTIRGYNNDTFIWSGAREVAGYTEAVGLCVYCDITTGAGARSVHSARPRISVGIPRGD
jgi:hypothetical protein